MLKLGMWITNGKGVYLVSDIDGEWVKLRDVVLDKNGVAYYGKERLYRLEDLEAFTIA